MSMGLTSATFDVPTADVLAVALVRGCPPASSRSRRPRLRSTSASLLSDLHRSADLTLGPLSRVLPRAVRAFPEGLMTLPVHSRQSRLRYSSSARGLRRSSRGHVAAARLPLAPGRRSAASPDDHDHPTDHIELSEQAQAEPRTGSRHAAPREYWRTIPIPGVVVDRPARATAGSRPRHWHRHRDQGQARRHGEARRTAVRPRARQRVPAEHPGRTGEGRHDLAV